MDIQKKHALSLKKLKKQVTVLQKKEENAKKKLKLALKKACKLGSIYQSKLDNKMRIMKEKLAKIQVATYAKVADDLEQQLLRGIESKTRALVSAVTLIEKKQAAKLKKSVAVKAKNIGKSTLERATISRKVDKKRSRPKSK